MDFVTQPWFILVFAVAGFFAFMAMDRMSKRR
jgi:hypothetical protein